MTDRYERIRSALARRPTPGPWSINTASVGVNGKIVVNEIYVYNPAVADDVAIAADIIDPETGELCEANARLIAACDPDTIRELLAERDALLDALRQITEWPDGGNRYGQENIKRFAQAAIDAAMRKENSND